MTTSTFAPVIIAPSGSRAHERRSDRALSVSTLVLAAFGVVVVYSATRGPDLDPGFAVRQGAAVVIGLAAMATIGRVPTIRLRAGAPFVALATGVALQAVLSPLGTEVNGTTAWLRIFGLSFQPAEVVKPALAVVLAALFTSRRRIVDRRRFAVVRTACALGVVATASALVLVGGETGSVLVYGALTAGVLVASGLPRRHLVALAGVALVVGVAVLATDTLAPYQRQRIEAFVDLDADPLGAGYNQRQSLTAIGSGGLLGKGLFQGPQTQLRYLPEQQTDFIFAVVSEELGFVGALALLAIEGLILQRVLAVCRTTDDAFGALICVAVFSFLAFQVVQNVAMNIGLLPVAGIPLPFVSYGGSALVASFAAIGLVQAVARGRGVRASSSSRPRGQGLHWLGADEGNRLSAVRVR